MKTQKKKFSMPNEVVLLFFMVILAMIMTWVIPGGSFERITDPDTGNVTVVAGSYVVNESTPVTPFEMLKIIPQSVVNNAVLCVYLLIIGGCMNVVKSTGTIDALIGHFMRKHMDKSYFLVGALTATIAFLSSTMGFASESFAFLPALLGLCIAVKLDAVVAAAIVLGGVSAGYGAATISPFSVGIAQTMVGLPEYSGILFRMIIFVVMTSCAVFFAVSYAKKVKSDPTKSFVADIDYSGYNTDPSDFEKLTKRHVLIALIYLGTILAIILSSVFSWFKSGLYSYTALFILVAILVGIIGKLSTDTFVKEFSEGCKNFGFIPIIIGLGAAIPEVMTAGGILDTVVYALTQPLEFFGEASEYISAVLMFFSQIVINIFMPSNSGQAIATMPIMGAIGDIVGINKQISVLAFSLGDGLTYCIFPTCGFMLIVLRTLKVPFTKWMKYALPLVAVQVVLAVMFMIIAVAIDFGPF